MDLTFSDRYDFQPEWNDNLKNVKPVKVYCKYLTYPERERCKNIFAMQENDGTKKIQVKMDQPQMLNFAIEKIEGLKVNGKEIKSADDLLASPRLTGLTNEIYEFVLEKEAKGQTDLIN